MDTILKVESVSKSFVSSRGIFSKNNTRVDASRDISFSIRSGETLGLVGESGCGKTTLARMIMGLEKPDRGEILFNGTNIYKSGHSARIKAMRNIGIVFQDPAASLNPRSTVADTLKRPLKLADVPRSEWDGIVAGTLAKVNLKDDILARYPHQMSGGQQQRVSIARAIILEPTMLILDEPTSALDLSVQARILNLLIDIQQKDQLTYLFITHDLQVVRYISDRIGVMYLGKLLELGGTDEIYDHAAHPYTYGLLSSAPISHPRDRGKTRFKLHGELTMQVFKGKEVLQGCCLASRCPFVREACRAPEFTHELVPLNTEHFCACPYFFGGVGNGR